MKFAANLNLKVFFYSLCIWEYNSWSMMILHVCLTTVHSQQFNLKLVLKVSYNTNIKMYFFNTYVLYMLKILKVHY